MLVLRLANLFLRGISMCSKLALVTVLARFLDPSEFGKYGLFTATAAFCLLIIGGDFYAYSQREFLGENQARWSFVIQHHVLAISIIYIICLPAFLLIFSFGLLPWGLISWFFILVITDHLAQEVNRLLIVMQHQLSASFVLFVRTGLWVWILVPIMWENSKYRDINSVFMAWLLGCISAIFIGMFIIKPG